MYLLKSSHKLFVYDFCSGQLSHLGEHVSFPWLYWFFCVVVNVLYASRLYHGGVHSLFLKISICIDPLQALKYTCSKLCTGRVALS